MSFHLQKFLLVVSLVCFSTSAFARKFDFKSENIATFIRGSWGPSNVGDKAYADSSGVSTHFSQKVESNFSGEFGFLLAAGPVNIRLSAELIFPRNSSEIKGRDEGGTELFNLKSYMWCTTPQLNLEYVYHQNSYFKGHIGAGGGISLVTLDNEYTFTATGNSVYSGIGDFTESSAGKENFFHGYIGFEVLAADNMTLVLDGGYRQLMVSHLNYTKDIRTFGNKTRKKDEGLKNNDDSDRALNMSGGYVGLGFRFYL